MQIKLTPFYLFLILLIVLVISMFVGKWFQEEFKESEIDEPFVDFYRDNNQYGGNMVYIPQYSGSIVNQKVMSLYDNVYFDITNANLVEVQSKDSSANDTSGGSIEKIFVKSRTGTNINISPLTGIFNSSNMINRTSDSLTSTVSSDYSQFLYNTFSTIGNDYNILYYSWDTNTFLVIMDSNNNIISIFLFNNSQLLSKVNSNNLSSVKTNVINKPVNTNASSTNGTVTGSVYKITPYVSYDYTQGNIIVDGQKYNRVDGIITNSTSFQEAYNYNAWSISDNNGGLVLVLSYKNATIITILALDNDNALSIVSTSRFNKNGIVINKNADVGTNLPQGTGTSGTGGTSGTSGNNNDISNKCGDDLSCKWYWYYHTLVDNDFSNNDFFLKSQVVPPVCPTCPNCPSHGTCTNCGGNGGSGTRIRDGSGVGGTSSAIANDGNNYTYVNADGSFSTSADPNTLEGGLSVSALSFGQNITALGNATGNTINNAVNTTGNIATTGLDNATLLAGGAGLGAYSLANNAGTGIYNAASGLGTGTVNQINKMGSSVGNFLRDAGSGATGLLRDTASGATGLLRDTGSGIVNLGNNRNRNFNNNNYNSGLGNNGIGNSYNNNRNNTNNSNRNSNNNWQNNPSNINQGTMGTMGTPVDNYSYYGATQSKGDNYMPVTADFSSFRK